MKLKECLNKEKKKLSHSYLFYGLEGTGKKRAATELICNIEKKEFSEEEIFSGKLEDIFILKPIEEEKKGKKIIKDITIEQVRQAIDFLNFLPVRLGWRFLVVDQAEKLNLVAGNSLLKIVEEPPRKAKIIFLAENAEKILPTLLSRLEKKYLRLFSKNQLREWIKQQRKDLTEQQIERVVNLSYGRIALAEKYLSDEILMLGQEQELNNFRRVIKGGLAESFVLAEKLAENKKQAQKSIDNWVFYLRDFLIKNLKNEKLNVAARKKILQLITGLLVVKEKLNYPSVNARLVWENFFLSIN